MSAMVVPSAGEGATNSAQPADLRRRNVSAVMRAVLDHGPIARADVASVTGLARGSVTKLTSRLIGAGLLQELSPGEPDRQPGRPRVPIGIDPRYRVIGVHIGLLWTIVGTVDLTGSIVSEKTLPHRGKSFQSVVQRAAAEVQRQVASAGDDKVIGVGASIGGWVDPHRGLVVEHSPLGWQDAPLLEALAARIDVPVLLDSTVRAIALAESWFGAGVGVGSLLHVFVGNIVGAGMVMGRKLHFGPQSAAGYLDHFPVGTRTSRTCACGRHDCMQAVASDVAVVDQARSEGLLGADGNLDDLAELARGGHSRAATMLRTRARHVGSALALLVEIINPDRVVVGGGVADHPEYLPDLRAAMLERLHRPVHLDPAELVQPTTFGRHAVMLASGMLFLDAFYRDPMAFSPLRAQ